MNKNSFFKICGITLLLSTSILFADSDTTPPTEDGTKFFNQNTVDYNSTGELTTNEVSEDEYLIGDDNVSKSNINQGIIISRNLGEATGRMVADDSGRLYYVERNADGSWPNSIPDVTTTLNYEWESSNLNLEDPNVQTYRAEYEEYWLESNKTIRFEKQDEMKKKGMTRAYSANYTVADMKARFMSGRNGLSGAQEVTTDFRQPLNNEEIDSRLREREDNATRFYSDTFSSTFGKSDRDIVLNQNYGALTKAYRGLNSIVNALTARLTGAVITCQISRELVPSYMCKIPGKDGLVYPGPADDNIRKVNSREAEKACNKDCHTDPGQMGCFRRPVIPSMDVTTVSLPTTTIKLYPPSEFATATAEWENVVSNKMPIEYIKIRLEMLNPTDSNMTDLAWDKYLSNLNLKFRYSIYEAKGTIEKTYGSYLPIVDKAIFTVKSSRMEFNIPLVQIQEKLRFEFYEPFTTSKRYSSAEEREIMDRLLSYNPTLEITYIEAKYSSDSFYFCEALQMVAEPGLCVGGEVIEIPGADFQFEYLCNSDSRKIGPEPTYGAFFSQESCERACIYYDKCIPSYRHYSTGYGATTDLYKTEIDCMDVEENNNCSKVLCEAYFNDSTIRPNNEYLVENDDTVVYTIRNRVLTDIPRPKIDLAGEAAATTDDDFKELFASESKDSAYLAMLKEVTFNRIKYRIGTPSPHNLAYSKESLAGSGGSVYYIDLKPNSYDIDTATNYYLYSVIELEHTYTPVSGVWYLNGTAITATETNIQWRDKTYLIKNSENNEDWSMFRRVQFHDYLIDREEITMDWNTGEFTTELIIDWIPTPELEINRYETYNIGDNSFSTLSSTAKAPSFKRQNFTSEMDFHRYLISDHIERDFFNTPGVLIKDQAKIDHETNFLKIFNVPVNHINKSNAKDYNIYFVYSDVELSYEELMVKVEGVNYLLEPQNPENNEWAAYQLSNEQLFKQEITYDGEINNGIKTLILGQGSNSTVSINWEPSIKEKGKEAFKFIFLYDDQQPNPFEMNNEVAP